jgi:hypothetical protein
MTSPPLAAVHDETPVNGQSSFIFSPPPVSSASHSPPPALPTQSYNPEMNGNFTHPEVKNEPDELNKASTEDVSTPSLPTMKSPPPSIPGPTASIPVRSSAASLDVPPDSSRAVSSTPEVQPVKSPRTSLSPSVARNPLASLQSAKRKRLPQDKVGQLEDRIALDARDADAWLALIGEHQAKGKISDARNTYERFFKVFPDLVRSLVNS